MLQSHVVFGKFYCVKVVCDWVQALGILGLWGGYYGVYFLAEEINLKIRENQSYQAYSSEFKDLFTLSFLRPQTNRSLIPVSNERSNDKVVTISLGIFVLRL